MTEDERKYRERGRIGRIEDMLRGLVAGSGAADVVYASTLPTGLPKGLKRWALVTVAGGVEDMGGYRRATCNIYLYARSDSGGRKDYSGMDAMEDAVERAVEEYEGEGYAVSHVYSSAGYDGECGSDFNVVCVNLIIS